MFKPTKLVVSLPVWVPVAMKPAPSCCCCCCCCCSGETVELVDAHSAPVNLLQVWLGRGGRVAAV